MTQKKLTTAIATQMVDRIEALHDQINAVYREATCDYDGSGNANLIRDAWKARRARREEEYNERALLESCDVRDETA